MAEVKVGQVWKDRYRIPDRYVRVAVVENFVGYVQARICQEDGILTGNNRRRQPILAARFPKFYDLHRDFIDGALTDPLPPRKLAKSYNPARNRHQAFGADPKAPLPKVRSDPLR
jgi:hypothetical protein